MIADVLSKCDPREDREFKNMKELVTTMVEEIKETRKTNERVVTALDKLNRMEKEMDALRTSNDEMREQLKQHAVVVRHQQTNRIVEAARNSNSRATGNVRIKRDAHPAHESGVEEIVQRERGRRKQKFILIGDLNARFGNERTALIEEKNFPMPTHYAPSLDPVTSTNVNARYAIESLRNSFVLLDELCSGSATHKTALRFRQRSRWLSELDTSFASPELLPLIRDFEIHQRLDLPSDQAPISCCIALNRLECSRNMQPLVDRAEELGRPSTQQDPSNNTSLYQRRTIKVSQIDSQLAAEALNTTPPPDLTLDDTDTIVNEVNNMLYNIASNARITTSPAEDRCRSVGVRQGSPTSCLLFTLLANDMIRNLKEKCQPDGYLERMHVLMLMDNTVLLATSQKRAEEKVRALEEFCTSSGMMINQAKTQFIAINGAAEDWEPLKVDGVTIENCSSYTYLECSFTQDANLKNTINEQCSRKMCHVIKFEVFIEQNRNAPFKVKEKVWSAALVFSILYGIESWLGLAAIKTANAMYMRSVRTLLGVRKTTTGELCLIEAGLLSLVNKTKLIQKKTLEKFDH
ncbi:hypothetical protein CAPTEDRAFT_207491 [Capitella teleta]|uniref:Reverse transcriptase domain-containing protein n=1 Tax=Capitella teleta TaxID=283909 RepID=R7TLC2_CAPTE|nr:hypothetical protein CAPTEDRAFT_207491 [Capitella teleta]|eukprot:ELT94648.1 hypothetical protein CAPTEDRAFT_207491 [Capitella teleta]